MPDDELRQLERATSEAPGDFVLGRRYVQALERAGDRRGAQLERLRIARSGDEETRVALRSLLPLPPRLLGKKRERPGDREPIAATSSERRTTFSIDGLSRLIAATETLLFVRTRRGIIAIETVTLSERWQHPLAEQAPSAVCGSDLVIADGRDVVLLDGESGGELARAGTAGQVVSLGAEYDRGAALVGANRGRLPLLIGLELGRDFGRTIWKRVLPGGPLREVERRKIHGVAVGHVVVDNSSTHGYRLEDGAPSEDSSWRVCWTTVSCTTDSLASPEPKGLPELRLARDPALRFRRSQAEIAHARNLTYVLSFGRQVTQAPGGEIVLPHAQLVNFVARDDVSGRVLIDRNLEVDSLGEFGELEVVALPRAVLALVCDLGRLEIFRFESASYRPNQPT